jgi:hypothetical protein
MKTSNLTTQISHLDIMRALEVKFRSRVGDWDSDLSSHCVSEATSVVTCHCHRSAQFRGCEDSAKHRLFILSQCQSLHCLTYLILRLSTSPHSYPQAYDSLVFLIAWLSWMCHSHYRWKLSLLATHDRPLCRLLPMLTSRCHTFCA